MDSIKAIFEAYWKIGFIGLILGGAIIQISPIKFDPYTWLAKKIGHAINQELLEKIEEIEKKLTKHIEEDELEDVRATRQRILEFDTECCRGEKHTKEHFDEILRDVDVYVKYCKAHEDYLNSKADIACKHIKEVYESCVRENSFI